jgi:hypothetical protein
MMSGNYTSIDNQKVAGSVPVSHFDYMYNIAI